MSYVKAVELIRNIGADAALILCGYYGNRTLYVPAVIPQGHFLSGLIGDSAAEKLQNKYGGQGISVPTIDFSPLRRRAIVRALVHYKVPVTLIADVLDISVKRVTQIIKEAQEPVELSSLLVQCEFPFSDEQVVDSVYKSEGAPIEQTSRGDAEPRSSASSAS